MFFLKGSSSNYSFRDSQSVKESSHDEEYIVEAILNKRKINRKVYYYLKWKNYSSRHNSWEPEANLDCDDLILEFENQLKCKKTKTNSQNRECSFLRSSSDSSFPDYGLFESGRESPSDVKVDECDEANEKMEGLDEVLIKKTNVQKRKYNISITANVTSLSEDVLSKKRRETIPSDQEVNKVYETCEKLENVEEFSKTDFIEQCNGKVEVGRFEWKNDLSFLTFDKISTLEGKEPEEVLHAFRPSDKLVLVVKWKGIVTPEFVLSEEFIVKYPQLAIKFYEKKITWG